MKETLLAMNKASNDHAQRNGGWVFIGSWPLGHVFDGQEPLDFVTCHAVLKKNCRESYQPFDQSLMITIIS